MWHIIRRTEVRGFRRHLVVDLPYYCGAIEEGTHPTTRRQPLDSVHLMVCFLVQCLYKDSFTSKLCKGGGGSRPHYCRMANVVLW